MTAGKLIEVEPGLKIATQVSPEPDVAELEFVRQMGVEYAVTWVDASKIA